MKKTSFGKSLLKGCDFKETELGEGDFRGCDLEGTLFHGCDLSRADFRDAVNYSIDPQSNRIAKGKFSIPEALSLLKGFDITLQ